MSFICVTSIFLLFLVEESSSFPKINKTMYAFYNDGEKDTAELLHNAKGKVTGKLYLMLENREYFYAHHVVISCGHMNESKIQEYMKINYMGIIRFRLYPSTIRQNCMEDKVSKPCSITYICRATGSLVLMEVETISFENLNIAIYGEEKNYLKYVGCFEGKQVLISTEPVYLEQTEITCEAFCHETSFYSYNYGMCACVKSLPKVSSNELCELNLDFHRGTNGHVIVFSKNLTHHIPDIDPLKYIGCFDSNPIYCPDICKGRFGPFCAFVDCEKHPELCEGKSCRAKFSISKDDKSNMGLCLCGSGFYMSDSLQCSDVDECIMEDPCKIYNGNCTNKEGGYSCTCGRGFKQMMDNCSDADECDDVTICDQETTTCSNLFGDYECTCLKGYIKKEPENIHDSCEDDDECDDVTICDQETTKCSNLFGDYECNCLEGYIKKEPENIHDIDECIFGDPCEIFNGTCTNKQGGYSCTCGRGFKQMMDNCSDIDECDLNITICDQETTNCGNLFGDYECICLEGYIKKEPENIHSSCKVSRIFGVASVMYFVYALIGFLLAVFILCASLLFYATKKK